MALIAKASASQSKQLKPGQYVARCYSIVDLGSHKFKDNDYFSHKIRITWEFPTELETFKEENGQQPYVMGQDYTLSLGEKSTFKKMLEAWLGRKITAQEASEGFNVKTLLGKEALIQVVEQPSKTDPTKIYANIQNITSIPKGMECPAQINASILFSIEEWNELIYGELPEFVQKKIMDSKEYKEKTGEIPFGN
jgi:hypothetical protein